MINLLIALLVLILFVGIIFWILSLLPIPQPWANIARAIVAIIVLIILFEYLPLHSLRLN